MTNITIFKGDTLSFGVEIEGLGDQTLETAFFTIKAEKTDTTYLIQKSLGDGIEQVEGNAYRIRVAPAETNSLEPNNYFYDLEIGLNSDIFTVLNGKLTVYQDITEREA